MFCFCEFSVNVQELYSAKKIHHGCTPVKVNNYSNKKDHDNLFF